MPSSHIKLDEAAHICEPGVLTERWEAETKAFPQVLSELRDSVPNNRAVRNPCGSPQTFIDVSWHACAYTHIHEHTHTYIHRDRERGENFRRWEKVLVFLKYDFFSNFLIGL